MELTEEFVWEGRRIAHGRAGSGPAVVFCHGTPFSSRVWSPYADALADRYAVHLWDLPGYGRSSKDPEHPVDFVVFGRALRALLDHWGLERPHVIAHDFGGATSLRAALVEGAAYASQLLVDVVAIPPAGSPFFRFVREHPDAMAELPGFAHHALVEAYLPGASHRGLTEAQTAELVEPWLGAEGQPAFYRQIAQYDERHLVDLENRLADITWPTRVVWGADDGWLPAEVGRRLAGWSPGRRTSRCRRPAT